MDVWIGGRSRHHLVIDVRPNTDPAFRLRRPAEHGCRAFVFLFSDCNCLTEGKSKLHLHRFSFFRRLGAYAKEKTSRKPSFFPFIKAFMLMRRKSLFPGSCFFLRESCLILKKGKLSVEKVLFSSALRFSGLLIVAPKNMDLYHALD